jgi:hypothetical protein
MVAWFNSKRPSKKADEKRTWRQELTIPKPDQDDETRLVWTSPSTDEAKTSRLLDVLNELGAEGWELIEPDQV